MDPNAHGYGYVTHSENNCVYSVIQKLVVTDQKKT